MGKVKKVTGIDVAAPVRVVQQGISSIGNATGISPALTQVFQPLEKTVVQPISQGLASIDKTVGNAIPGGWGTVASIAGSAMGVPTPYMVGLGALNGSGVMRKGASFNLQGAMLGGAMAYGASELGEYMRGAVPDVPTVDTYGNLTAPAVTAPTDGITSLYNSTGGFGQQLPSAIPQSAINAANVANPALLTSADIGALNALSAPIEAGAGAGLQVAPQPSILSNLTSGNFGYAADQIGSKLAEGATSVMNAPANAYEAVKGIDYSGALDKGLSNASQTGEGIKNLLGAGDMSAKAASQLAASTAKAAGTTAPIFAAGATLYGGMGLAALDEQRKYLEESKRANAISQAEYDSALAEINRSADVARKAVAENPFNDNPDRSYTPTSNLYAKYNPDENLYERLTGQKRQYAAGGSIDDESGMDEARGLYQGNLQNGFMGGSIPSYSKGGEARERRDLLDMIQAEFRSPPAQYVEGMGFMTPPPSVEGRLGANFDALGGNIRAGASGMAMMSPDKRIMAMPTMMDIGYKGQVGPGTLDVGVQRAMKSVPGRGRDYAANVKYEIPFAEGGQARFLSGGGDGMSDSIPATISGKQEARLADGEFVVPADVVSHLGNGSSKAGAKQLYSMMDKVRSARTGTKQQGKQINPRKYLPA
jgi:hypothetical protein